MVMNLSLGSREADLPGSGVLDRRRFPGGCRKPASVRVKLAGVVGMDNPEKSNLQSK